ncbi:hypothetical protein [Patiriisocius sp. Uisw_017]|jgi:hypothetical protein|uniref:hypothetical protein n=1 Tax=Patiriisocius sp. Uisw_017 TaxID=3230968 RepID=UPI0039ECEB54
MTLTESKLLKQGLFYDIVGMLSVAIPLIGTFLDILWAPFAAKKMTEMYPGRDGKIASFIVFIEEILPITDFIPTFTLMWLYTFVGKKEPENRMRTIKIRSNQ